MILGKYLKYAIVGSALVASAAGEESKDKHGSRRLGRKNRTYSKPVVVTDEVSL
jgi:hypothetical protein